MLSSGNDALQITDPAEGYCGLQQWSGPLVYDRLVIAYSELASGAAAAHNLACLHARVWRSLIDGDADAFLRRRDALIETLIGCGLTLDDLAEADTAIMTELLEVVMARYNRSPRTARAYHLALMQLAGWIRPVHAAA